MPAVPRLRSAGTAPPHPPGGRLAPSSRRRGLGSPSRTTSCCTSGSSPPVESRGGHPGAPPIPPGSAPRPGPRGGHLRPRPLRGRGVGRSARHTAAKPATSGGAAPGAHCIRTGLKGVASAADRSCCPESWPGRDPGVMVINPA